jgi:hypothetical protein
MQSVVAGPGYAINSTSPDAGPIHRPRFGYSARRSDFFREVRIIVGGMPRCLIHSIAACLAATMCEISAPFADARALISTSLVTCHVRNQHFAAERLGQLLGGLPLPK